jgi:uncharacterized protein (TIGR02996 family)
MTPEEAFIEAIRDAPDDDTPRLIYADWLEEHGDPHGEFIRVQCELANLPEGDPRRSALTERERELWERNRVAWEKPGVPPHPHSAHFFRGFFFIGHHQVNDYPEHEAYWARWAPVQRVSLFPGGVQNTGSVQKFGKRLGRCSSLAGWLRLRIRGVRDARWLLPVLHSRHLRRLRELELFDVGLGGRRVAAIAQLTNLPALSTLSFMGVRGGDRGAVALANAPHLAGLTSLRYSSMDLTDVGAQALAASPFLAHLQKLDLRGNDAVSSQARQLLFVRFGNRVQF